jgi:two-component system, NtrC family, nitrogen regulation response regulator NtrX
MTKILVIDDERPIRSTLQEILEFEKFKVDTAEDGKIGLEMIQNTTYDLVLCDIKMPKMDGMELLDKLNELGVEVPIIMISGHGNIETAVEAIKKGAYDFIQKPLDLNRTLVTLRNALDRKEIAQENKVLKRKVSLGKITDIIGESEAIKSIKEMINKVAPTDARVLITGENGAGKELVARQLHEKSERSKMPFIEVNCAAIPGELIESELFGHEKGAFTSAIKTKPGKFELADGGSLFLDEVGDMSLSAQAKVLRALQEGRISRVGGEKELAVNVRVFAATNKDLRKEIDNGNFREDLYHRLNVIPIHVPSLNERRDDIPLLAGHFMNMICGDQGIVPKKISTDGMKALQTIDWTGNIRELRNIIERLIILCGPTIENEDVKKYANIK